MPSIKTNERGQQHQLVRKRIQYFSNVGDPAIAAREIAVEQIGQKRCDEYDQHRNHLIGDK
ncbi:hypothetical protein SDC9_174346 [bioreactor metagenome]|uniref:Uncharacterized protein n=1 Tax=bioreactor metagenome TaxID=1076179 RepID=A0A645GL90_9ZZZZ